MAPVAAAAFDVDEHGWRDQRYQRCDQHHRRDRHVPEGDEDEDRQRRQHRDRQLRHVLAEERLQLFDAVDNRQHDPTGALAGKPGRPQCCDLVVETAAQILLHAGGGAVRDHRAVVIDDPAQRHRDGDPGRRKRYREKAGAVEDMGQQHAEDREAGNPDDGCDEPHQHRQCDPPAQP